MAGERYVVTAPLIVVKVPGAQGGEAYVKRDRLLPTSVRSKEIDRLLALGLIELDPVTAAEAAAELIAQQVAAEQAETDRINAEEAAADAKAAEEVKAAESAKKPTGK